MQQSADPSPESSDAYALAKLEEAVAALCLVLSTLDQLGLEVAAGHVSFGHEMALKDLKLLQNGGTLSALPEPDVH